MTHDEMMRYLFSRLNYERAAAPSNRRFRLEPTQMLLEWLGMPHQRYPIIHIAGTKGKGSTAHMLAAMLSSVGYRVGLHTSPNLHRVEERFLVNGQPPGEQTLPAMLEEMIPGIDEVDRRLSRDDQSLSFFEITTAMALWHFARRRVDWGVIEVGLGGRLDATNVVDPEAAVITSISKDHTRQLGDTLAAIAREKAGIVKWRRPAVSGVYADEPKQVIEETCRRLEAPLKQVGVDFDYRYENRGLDGGTVTVRTWRREWPPFSLRLLGEHQARNAAIAAAALDVVDDPRTRLDPRRFTGALERLTIPCRIEVIGRRPLVILDVAHNEASAQALAETLRTVQEHGERPIRPRVMIFGASRDKDWRTMLRVLLPVFDAVVVTNYLGNPRAVPASELAEALADMATTQVESRPDPCSALGEAQRIARDGVEAGACAATDCEAMICVCGSFFLAAEVKEAIDSAVAAPAM